jgi:SAM-dependent methyltransferase
MLFMAPMPEACTNHDETTLFRQSWTLYDALSEMNYMFHREVYEQVGRLLAERHEAGPWSMLDLGCGNARFLGPCLRRTPPASYTGVDLSPTALEEAGASYLKGLGRVTLRCQDMLEAVEQEGESHDVIFSSYAVHHLGSALKQRLFQACSRRLKAGGSLVLVDVAREEGQSREDYLEGYIGTMRSEWKRVPPAQLDEACAHVAAFDFPETLSTLTRMAEEAGLTKSRLIGQHAQHHVLVFEA